MIISVGYRVKSVRGTQFRQWATEVNLLDNKGLKVAELRLAESIIEENKEMIVERWNEFFKDKK